MSRKLDLWLESRGLDPELASKLGWSQVEHEHLGASVRIPFVRDGKTVTTQYRSLEGKEFRFAQGSEIELYNVDCLKDGTLKSQPLLICEGACDALALMQCGYQRVVAVPGWSEKNVKGEDYAPFATNEASIAAAEEIVFAGDSDNTGASMLKAITTFFDGNSSVSHVRWPDGCKDANDCLRLEGQEGVVRAVNARRAVDPPGGVITGFSDAPLVPEREIWRVGFQKPDREFFDLLAFRSRAISVITGRPGDGKTTFVTWAANCLTQECGIRIGMCLFETEVDEVVSQIAQMRGKDYFHMSQNEKMAFKKDLDDYYRIAHKIEDEAGTTHDLVWLRNIVRRLAGREHCKVIFIDPWNELEHLPEKGESMTAYVNFALTKLRQWAEKYDCHICIIAHPKKLNGDETPTGYHISDSAAWMNKPDIGWTIAQDRDIDTRVMLSCWKVRSRTDTRLSPGKTKLRFDSKRMIYREGWNEA